MASAPFTFGFSPDNDDEQEGTEAPRASAEAAAAGAAAAATAAAGTVPADAPVSNVPVVKHDLKAMVSHAVCLLFVPYVSSLVRK